MIDKGRSDRTLSLALAVSSLMLLVVALSPVTALASITFGSDLKTQAQGFSDTCVLSTAPCTEVLTGVRQANRFPAASPTDGVVVSFGIKSSAADTVTFRLARVKPGPAKASGAGTGPDATLPGAGTYSFPAHVPVRAGDYVGVDTSSVSAYSSACETGGREFTYHPTLVDGGPFQGSDSNSTCEFLVNAKVRPSNRFTFDGVFVDDSRGTAKLALVVPGPGRLALSGDGVKRVTKDASKAGHARLSIRSKGKTKRRLIRRGKVTVDVEVTFKPEGGDPRTKSKTVKLTRR